MTDASSPISRLTPAQESTLDLLRRSGDALVFSEAFVKELREEAMETFAHFADRLDGDTIFVTKHTLAGVFGCEAQFLAPDEFEWTPARARGQVSHRAIQLLINWRGEPEPGELVDEAIARLVNEEKGLAPWLESLGQGDLADLRAMSSDHVTKFMECFPPLDARSRPVTESSTQWPVDGPILLRGRADLTMGKPFERESRKLIVPQDGACDRPPPRRPSLLRNRRDTVETGAATQVGELLPRCGPANRRRRDREPAPIDTAANARWRQRIDRTQGRGAATEQESRRVVPLVPTRSRVR